ncbi:sugar phosphate isomerase/epimerase family protein [Paenibacillus qinlingensis]|uniref:sugar phosphate isomerase/epimerase family protein n=1 Tax=Paenibacillus qinlingensis TaxID=1837343 RepID=UPI00156679A8|nr:sugar phosphate isomerase/epimerase family protein [Paenibacillus qinlingensis]NQX60737.1 sugar phosphate isomerase/epimerase [Paenibacillus qinlingensis]
MNPKLSIGSWAFAFGPFEEQPWSFSRILAYAKEAGYDGVEVNGFLPHPVPDVYDTIAKRKALVDEIHAHGLGVSAYAPDFRKAPPAVANKTAYLELVKRYIDFTVDLGTDILRVDTVTSPNHVNEQTYAQCFHRLLDTWQASAELAAEAGLRIVWEFEPGFWLNKPSEVVRAVTEVNHPAFQVLFDTSHAYMSGVIGARQAGVQEVLQGGIVEYAKQLEGHIGHFHLIDSDGTLHDEETSTHAEFGAGHIDFPSFLKETERMIAPLEWWCVDFCFNAEVEAWGKQAVHFIRNAIKEAGKR